MKQVISAVVITVLALVAGPSMEAKSKTLSGDWTFTVEHLPLKLVLVQKGKNVTGVLDYPHGDPIHLTGTFKGETLRLSGDGTGPNFTVHLDATGALQRDGTFAGGLKALIVDLNDDHQPVRKHDQDMQWTAARGLNGVRHFQP